MQARWNHNAIGLVPFERAVDRLFRDIAMPALELKSVPLAAAADVVETREAIVVRMDLPGFDPKALDVKVEKDLLTIRGERREEERKEGETYHRAELRYGSFARSFALPVAVDGQKAQARYENGVLEVRLPKREEAKPRSIEVKVG